MKHEAAVGFYNCVRTLQFFLEVSLSSCLTAMFDENVCEEIVEVRNYRKTSNQRTENKITNEN